MASPFVSHQPQGSLDPQQVHMPVPLRNVRPQTQLLQAQSPSQHQEFGNRKRPVNKNGVPWPEFNCSVRLMLIPKNTRLAVILRLISPCGRLRSIEFIPGLTQSTNSALIVFTEAESAHNLIDRCNTEGLQLHEHKLRALPGFVHIFSHPPLQPEQTRVLLIGGYGDVMKDSTKLMEFCKRHIPGFEVICFGPRNADENMMEQGTVYIWELHFAKIDKQAARYKEILEKGEFHGQELVVSYGPDPCESLDQRGFFRSL